MKLFKKIFILIFVIFFCVASNAIEIKVLALINNYPISNYDLFVEIKTRELIYKNKITRQNQALILSEIINEKIKELEVEKNNIKINNLDIEKKMQEIQKNIGKNENINDEIKKNIRKMITINQRWGRLIAIKFGNKLEINTNEIISKMQNKDLNNEDLNKLIRREKDKKINVIAKTYLNKIKKNYFIELY